MIDVTTVAKYHNRQVTMNIDTGIDGEGNPTFETAEGLVLVAVETGVVLRHRSNTRIVELKDILDIEEVGRPRRRKVLVRYLREPGADDSVKQHLADRHGVMVSVLNAVQEEDAIAMHAKIKHDDLGHRHGDRPRRGNTDTQTAVEAMEDLDEEE